MITLLIPDCRIRTFRRWVSFLANVFELYELLLHWIVFQSPSNLLKKPWKMVHRVIGLIWRTGLSFLTEKPSYVKFNRAVPTPLMLGCQHPTVVITSVPIALVSTATTSTRHFDTPHEPK
ncbi:hypothetical protein F9C07_1933354 [Aspergillus flavus]|uniref:Uncharacterized protein n=1 Tax=Aspergillus flavus (strain ATCC 200026 / FGSC A1120 / IAM 13836 / NRRL 3357 / JCM 12722 / SRRC 167) TaxID=332952 RepID=A0A7U2R1J3_ASPFN|nr:hypothetical protein F9C07_1933354 [Aspergillus flavus]